MGLEYTGIYRVPGNNAMVSLLQDQLNKGVDINPAEEVREYTHTLFIDGQNKIALWQMMVVDTWLQKVKDGAMTPLCDSAVNRSGRTSMLSAVYSNPSSGNSQSRSSPTVSANMPQHAVTRRPHTATRSRPTTSMCLFICFMSSQTNTTTSSTPIGWKTHQRD